MFVALVSGVLKVDHIKETSAFLIEIMPAMFIPAAVGLIDVWDLLESKWPVYLLIIVVSTILVMVISGLITQAVIGKEKQ